MLILDKELEHLRDDVVNIDMEIKYGCGYYLMKKRPEDEKGIAVHTLIHPSKYPLVTDHINRNKCDNRRCNLRSVTREQNAFNRPSCDGTYPGVRVIKGKYVAMAQGKHYGRSKNLVEVIKIRRAVELEVWGLNWFDYEGLLEGKWKDAYEEVIF